MEKFKFDLGDKVKDKVTGYTGIIIGQTRWLYGCTRYTIQAQELKDGKPVEAISCDEAALDVVVPVEVKDPVRKSGGPTREPSRAPSASRGR